jgi:hypothetical protein
MISESALEWYEFVCRHCDHHWVAGYRARHWTDSDGTEWATYHRSDGATMENPAFALHICPSCHHATITVYALGRYDAAP